MPIIMYERVGFEGRRPSPFSWRIRYALTHKGVEVDYRPVRFADVEIIKQLSGQHFVPIIRRQLEGRARFKAHCLVP